MLLLPSNASGSQFLKHFYLETAIYKVELITIKRTLIMLYYNGLRGSKKELRLRESNPNEEFLNGELFITNGELLVRLDDINYTLAPNEGSAVLSTFYGSFYHTQSLTQEDENEGLPIPLNTTAESNGVDIVDNNKITFANPGTYNVQFSAQLDKTNSSTGKIWIWLKKNGTNVAWSASEVVVAGSTAETIAAWNFIVTTTTEDEYVQLYWAVNDTAIRLKPCLQIQSIQQFHR